MNYTSLKNALSVISFIVIVELLSYLTGMPFSAADVMLFPLSVYLIVLGIKSLVVSSKNSEKSHKEQYSLSQLSGYLLATMFIFVLGVWSVVSGFDEPLTLFSGVNGYVHGYTLLSLGILISGVSLYVIYNLILIYREQILKIK